MLERLYIKNYALIEEVSLEFCSGFNVLTGETGAGKSILIDAVAILLGGRAQQDAVRTGADKAVVEGTFRLPPGHPVIEMLKDCGVETDDGTVIMAREIAVNGRSACRVNGRTITLAQYRKIGLLIVDIHGQHDHQSLLQAQTHLAILDRFGGSQHLAGIDAVKESFAAWLALKKELEELRDMEKNRLQRIDFLRYQVKEIEEAHLNVKEVEELTREATLLANAEKIASQLSAAYAALFAGEQGACAYEYLSGALKSLHDTKNMDPLLQDIAERLESALYSIEDSATEIRDYLENIEFSPVRLEQVESRLHFIKGLCKKYGPLVEDVINYGKQAREELDKWERSSQRTEELETLLAMASKEYLAKAGALSQKRRELALKLEERVTKELLDLAMPHVRFAVDMEGKEASPDGIDRVEFLISPNTGEPLLPVARIASGGELSRIMLALKTIMAALDGIGTLIFDEIDAGIGGKAVQKVAEKLESISASQQVICVTHSSLIAARADYHLLIEKTVSGGRTRTFARLLTEEERVEELARMLGGEKQTADLKRHAEQILKKAK